MKSKFAGLLRGLLRRVDTNGATVVAAAGPVAVSAPARGVSPAAASPFRTRPAFTPPPPAPAAGANGLQLPLPPIIAALPMDLRAKLLQTPPADSFISIPVEKVLSQLAHGAVKISFGELRAARPGLFVSSGTENDARQIALPLNEIISRISPALLSRRTVKKVDVDDDITGPFGTRTPETTFTPLTATTATAQAAPAPPSPRTVQQTSVPTAPTVAPAASVAPAAIPAAPRFAKPPPPPFVKPSPPPTFAPKAPAAPARVAPAPAAEAFLNGPVKSLYSTPSPVAGAAIPFTPPPADPVAGGFNSAPQISLEDPILAPLAALAEKWPEAIKAALVQADLMGAQAALPPSLIAPGLKRGRVTIQWKNLCPMIRPKPAPVSIRDEAELELPLMVLAPLFFSNQKAAGQAKKRTAVSAEIPDLFFGSTNAAPMIPPAPVRPPMPVQQAPAPVAAPIPAAPAPTAAPAPAAPARPADTNYFTKGGSQSDTELRRQPSLQTDFLSRGATPEEVVARAMALPGVAGAVVALYDGLMIASRVPPELNADTVAAFLPQLYSRMSQSTKELRMGELNNLNFTVGNVPWKIFRVNALYFAAFGHAGEAMPSAPLAALAGLLDRKKQ